MDNRPLPLFLPNMQASPALKKPSNCAILYSVSLSPYINNSEESRFENHPYHPGGGHRPPAFHL